MEADPASALFGDEPDLYAALNLSVEATNEEIKKAYRKLALQHHPDKLSPTASEEEREASSTAFQRIGYAYAVLSDEKRRSRFDKTGRTDESLLDGSADWNDYFKTLWEGEVNAATIDEFYEKYVGSEEERQDLFDAYNESKGSIEFILANVNAPDASTAEDRFTTMINGAIKDGSIKSLPAWSKGLKDTKGRAKRRKAADKEAKAAEAAAKELGVHEKLFGKSKGGDEESLKALIQARSANRMEALIGSLEAKYGADEDEDEPAPKKSKRSKTKAAEPTDEGP